MSIIVPNLKFAEMAGKEQEKGNEERIKLVEESRNCDEEILIQIKKREAANAALKKMLEELEKKNNA